MDNDEFKIIENGGTRKIAIKKWNPLYRALMVERGITHLVLSGYFGWRSPDVSFLGELPFLERLDLMVPRIRDVSPIYCIPMLRELNVDGNVPEIDFTRILSLRSVALNWSPKKFASLTQCTQIETLGVSYVRDSDLSTFQKLRKLSTLTLGYSDVSSLCGIQHMEKLTRLGLARVNKLTSLRHLQDCKLLSYIHVEGAKLLEDVSAMSLLQDLRTVGFMDCPNLESISSLSRSVKLESIYLLTTTTVRDGRLKFMLGLPMLKHASIRDRKHYDLKSADLPKFCR